MSVWEDELPDVQPIDEIDGDIDGLYDMLLETYLTEDELDELQENIDVEDSEYDDE